MQLVAVFLAALLAKSLANSEKPVFQPPFNLSSIIEKETQRLQSALSSVGEAFSQIFHPKSPEKVEKPHSQPPFDLSGIVEKEHESFRGAMTSIGDAFSQMFQGATNIFAETVLGFHSAVAKSLQTSLDALFERNKGPGE